MSTEDLSDFLTTNGFHGISRKETFDKMNEIVNRLQFLIDRWILSYLKDENFPESVLRQRHAKVIPSGSYALNLVSEGSDLDLICMTSNLIERKKFYRSFKIFAEVQPGVDFVQSLEFNFCPLVTLVLSDVKIDLCLAIMDLHHLPEDLKLTTDNDDDDELLDRMDEKCIRSLNGHRNLMTILEMVPDTTLFKNVLMSVKLWAKRRSIYSNSIGYLGGVAWTVMVAHVCVTHRGLTQFMTLKKFFEEFSSWHWPKPVLLKELCNRKSGYSCWNPKIDYVHLMPIVLPCCPEQNCAYNVTVPTRNTIVEELKRGHSILKDLFEIDPLLADLFQPFHFFLSYRIFLVVMFGSQTNIHDHISWSGIVESRLRFLIMDLAKKSAVKSVRAFPKRFLLTNSMGCFLTKWYFGIERLRHGDKDPNLNLAEEIEKLRSLVYDRSDKYGWKRDGSEIKAFSIIRGKRDKEEDAKNFLPTEYNDYYLFDGNM